MWHVISNGMKYYKTKARNTHVHHIGKFNIATCRQRRILLCYLHARIYFSLYTIKCPLNDTTVCWTCILLYYMYKSLHQQATHTPVFKPHCDILMGPLWLTWINCSPSMEVTIHPGKCGMKLLLHSTTSTAPLKFGNRWIISSHSCWPGIVGIEAQWTYKHTHLVSA